jgi:hypothetical protein
MQADVRSNREVMEKKDAEKFRALYEEGRLLRPDQPGNVMARLAVEGERGLSGRFLRLVPRILPIFIGFGGDGRSGDDANLRVVGMIRRWRSIRMKCLRRCCEEEEL